ncbi:hypothetical protein JMA_18480 [Jeotgalibacillus malaysiensis]|uniref:Transcription regulator PadR N-terminal domain-containing protein n=1 Tax=Jeotgalibacillus malaysiensis TaxID=1508404 RepID=A0A0B5ALM4_9BACL|nr:PadR family transcriptional regulator [Jeotgalibacillus malaysiensis]AJD91165.1 hypothetical protein JMA_18480 [Jeotgalibacillus malaysiensis]
MSKHNPKKFALNMSASQFTKFYILHLLSIRHSGMISEHFKAEFRKIGGNWEPAPSTLLDALHDMAEEGLLHRKEDYKSHERKRQKVYWYTLTDQGRDAFEVMKKQFLPLFEEQKRIIQNILQTVFK